MGRNGHFSPICRSAAQATGPGPGRARNRRMRWPRPEPGGGRPGPQRASPATGVACAMGESPIKEGRCETSLVEQRRRGNGFRHPCERWCAPGSHSLGSTAAAPTSRAPSRLWRLPPSPCQVPAVARETIERQNPGETRRNPANNEGVPQRAISRDLQGERSRDRGITTACHAEGRGFESHQPLSGSTCICTESGPCSTGEPDRCGAFFLLGGRFGDKTPGQKAVSWPRRASSR
jgi:hypothetical protein